MADRNRAFAVSPGLAALKGTYPSAKFTRAAIEAGARERSVVVRLWISEGIPYAFRDCPALYEEVRKRLVAGLGIDSKQVSIAGSGRLGYSLAPNRWGAPYRPGQSDLDFFAVSGKLFEHLCQDFWHWKGEYEDGVATPGKGDNRHYWNRNCRETPGNIRNGLIDTSRVPNRPEYRHFLTVNRSLERLLVDLWEEARIGQKPKLRKRSYLRCYRDWVAFERQMRRNLPEVAKS